MAIVHDISVVSLADKYLIESALKNDRSYSHFHPSEFNSCHRKLAYAYYESEGYIKISADTVKINPTQERLFGVGHSAHHRWRKYLENSGHLRGVWMCSNSNEHKNNTKKYGKDQTYGVFKPEKCECGCTHFIYEEVGFYDEETWIGGHVDAILEVDPHKTIKDEDAYVIVDFKTISPYQYKNLLEPKPDHITQMQIYLYLSNLKVGKFVYENKATQEVREFRVIKNEEIIAEKIKEAKNLKYQLSHLNARGKRVLPSRKHEAKNNMECRYCKYKTHCWS